jgi:hypothetical protein
MSEPGEKAPEISALLDSLAKELTGSPRTEGKCASCGGEAKEFRDDLSRREYKISFLCQPCQDGVFGVNEP